MNYLQVSYIDFNLDLWKINSQSGNFFYYTQTQFLSKVQEWEMDKIKQNNNIKQIHKTNL